MISIHQDTEINSRDKGAAINYFYRDYTSGGTENELSRDQPFFPYSTPIYEETKRESEANYRSTPVTGEIEKIDITPVEKIVKLLKETIDLIDEVLEVYDDEIERINTFSLVDEKIKSLWDQHTEANDNFAEALVLLEVAVKNSRYQNYRKNQYKSIKMVLEKIKEVSITPQRAKECRKILMDNGIDLFAPIRNWEDYTIEIKKNNAKE